jgi:hypothetical protein
MRQLELSTNFYMLRKTLSKPIRCEEPHCHEYSTPAIKSSMFQCTQIFNFPENHYLMICYLIMYNGHHLEAEMLHLSQNLPEDYKGSMSARSMIQRYTTSKQGQVKWESLNCKTFSKSITRSNFHLQSSVLSAALNHLDELPVRKVYYLSFFL